MRDRFTLSSIDGQNKLADTDFLCKNYILSNSKSYRMSNGVKVSFDIEIPEGQTEEEVIKPIDFSHDPDKTYSDTFKFCNLRALDAYNTQVQNTYRYRSQSSDEDNIQRLNHLHIESMEAWGGETPISMVFDFSEAAYTTDNHIEHEENELYPLTSRPYYEGDRVAIYVLAVTDSLSVKGLDNCLIEPAPYFYNTFNNIDWNSYDYINGGFDTYTNYKEMRFNTPDFEHSQKYTNGMSQYWFGQTGPSLPFYHRYSDKSGTMTFNSDSGDIEDNTVRYTLVKVSGTLTSERKVVISNVKRDEIEIDRVSGDTKAIIPADILANGKVNCIKAEVTSLSPNNKKSNHVRAYIEQVDNEGITRRYYSDNIVSLMNNNSRKFSNNGNRLLDNENKTTLTYTAPAIWRFSRAVINNTNDITFGLFYSRNYLEGDTIRHIPDTDPHNMIGVYTETNGVLSYRPEEDSDKLKFNFSGSFEISYDYCDKDGLISPEFYVAFADIGEFDKIIYDISGNLLIHDNFKGPEYNPDAIVIDTTGVVGNPTDTYNTYYNVLLSKKSEFCYASVRNPMALKLPTKAEDRVINLEKLETYVEGGREHAYVVGRTGYSTYNMPIYFGAEDGTLTVNTKIASELELTRTNYGRLMDKWGYEYVQTGKIIEGGSLGDTEVGELISAINVSNRLDTGDLLEIPTTTAGQGNTFGLTAIRCESKVFRKGYYIKSIELKSRASDTQHLNSKDCWLAIYAGDKLIALSRNAQKQLKLAEWNKWHFTYYKMPAEGEYTGNLDIKFVTVNDNNEISVSSNGLALNVYNNAGASTEYGMKVCRGNTVYNWVPDIKIAYEPTEYYCNLADFEAGLAPEMLDLSQENALFEGSEADPEYQTVENLKKYDNTKADLGFDELENTAIVARKLRNEDGEYPENTEYYFELVEKDGISKYVPVLKRPGLVLDAFQVAENIVIDGEIKQCHRYYRPENTAIIYENKIDGAYIEYIKTENGYIPAEESRNIKFPYNIRQDQDPNNKRTCVFVSENGQTRVLYGVYYAPIAAVIRRKRGIYGGLRGL